MRPYADLFFMGAAFLLLETKNVATFALLFGTTWLVNALVFAGVLVIVLAAVETTRRFRTPPLPVVFAGIARVAGAGLYFVQPDWLLTLPFVPAADRGDPAGVPADLPGQRRVLQAVRRVRRLPGRRSALNLLGAIARRLPGVPGAAHRLPNLLLVVGGAVPVRVPAGAAKGCPDGLNRGTIARLPRSLERKERPCRSKR